MTRIADALGGKRIAITGTTGFLGTALLERLLRTVPEAEIVLLLRAGRRSTVQQRAAREIFRNDAFDVLRASLAPGGANAGSETFDEMVARRVSVIAGDVGRGQDRMGGAVRDEDSRRVGRAAGRQRCVRATGTRLERGAGTSASGRALDVRRRRRHLAAGAGAAVQPHPRRDPRPRAVRRPAHG